MDRILQVDGLTKVFTLGSMISRVRITATDHVSFYVKPAEIFALAGESGCGKTTTARMVLGFEEPTSGVVRYGGEVAGRHEKVWFTRGFRRCSRTHLGPSTR